MSSPPPPIYDKPYELGCGEVYNFWLRHAAELDAHGNLMDVESFKNSLIGNINKPMSIEEFGAKIPQKVIGRIKIYGLIIKPANKPMVFHFRLRKIKQIQQDSEPSETFLEEYIIEKRNGEVCLTSPRSFTKAEENIIYSCIAGCFKETTPFDNLSNADEIKHMLKDIFPFDRTNELDD